MFIFAFAFIAGLMVADAVHLDTSKYAPAPGQSQFDRRLDIPAPVVQPVK